MTIGIAAYGPNAGIAVLRALAAVEGVGRGAIGGFVSFVALTAEGGIVRASVQRGGTAALFAGGLSAVPDGVRTAGVAGLMSSGPDRPEPLSQFTPAIAGVGLVTGHRMPNTIGASGVNLNDEALSLIRLGYSPEEAVERVVEANPDVDAGIIALTGDGRIHAADTTYVQRRGDSGRAVVGTPQEATVAVLHNAIRPHRPLAALAAEVAMDVMRPADRPDGWITFGEGVRLIAGPLNAVDVDGDGVVKTIIVEDPRFLAGSWSLGIGYETTVLRSRRAVAAMLYEPYMVIEGGTLRSIDGQATLSVPIRSR